MKTIVTLFAFCMAWLCAVSGGGGNDPANAKPVRSAVVLHGDATLFNSLQLLSDEDLEAYYDSLSGLASPPSELMAQIDFFMEVRTLNQSDLAILLDSLFEAGSDWYPLINQINLYIKSRELEEIKFDYSTDTAPYPAHLLYGSWNTQLPHPYAPELCAADTVIRLKLAGGNSGAFAFPLDKCVLTSHYGHRWGRFHKGVDLDLRVRDSVRSVFNGMVRFVGFHGAYGRVIVVRHENGLETLYAHLHRFYVQSGDKVVAGQAIAAGGSSGHSTGSHLHFECRFKGVDINPMHIIDFKTQQLVGEKISLVKTPKGFAATPDGVVIHSVKKGEYLRMIADLYGTTCAQICEQNGIQCNSTLRVGQKLRIL
jgi:murein DD-endopeptidase MepM/ murein hydrolase activator NlpD